MVKIFFLFSLGLCGGLWIAWPGISTTQGWQCTKDSIFSSKEEPNDSKSIIESMKRQLRIGSAVSPKTLLKGENLQPMEKLRIIGDACFRD
tara:strand:+ start:115 stop:387 length:273 start_codon:yes stop_codon:yes gene_type:complete